MALPKVEKKALPIWSALTWTLPSFKWFLELLDHWGRWEAAVSLYHHLPFLNSFWFMPTVLVVAVGTLLFHQNRQFRAALEVSPHIIGVDYKPAQPYGWLKAAIIGVVCGLGFGMMAVPIWLMAFTPTIPVAKLQSPPTICKTKDCFPFTPPRSGETKRGRVVAPGGVVSLGQSGGITAGTVNQINPPFDPDAPVISFFYNGEYRKETRGSIVGMAGSEAEAFKQMMKLHDSKQWKELLDLSIDQMKKSPKWMTPYLFAGVAKGRLGDTDEALRLINYFIQQTDGNPDYGEFPTQARKMVQAVQEQKLRTGN